MLIIQIGNHCLFEKQPKTGVYTGFLKAFNGLWVSHSAVPPDLLESYCSILESES